MGPSSGIFTRVRLLLSLALSLLRNSLRHSWFLSALNSWGRTGMVSLLQANDFK